jgi:tetratricopeptide (TPR) repeat protein
LIDAKTDNQVWVQTYKESLVDVLSLQSKVARSIATEIQSKLTQQDKVRLARVRPVNPEAYLAYMKGRYYWDDFKEESLAKAIEQFTEAIRLDPNYAAAHAGLALAWRGLELVGAAPASETLPKAKEEAQKALALDASLPETHAVMGAVLEAEWNYQDGEVELRRALELNPSYTQAHLFFVTALRHQARHEEAISHAKRALELDPLSFLANENLGDTYVDARQYDRAIEQYQKALDLHPDHSNLHYHLGLAYAYNKMYEKGIAEILRSVKADDGDPDLSADLAYIYSVSGRKDEARKILRNLTLFSKEMAVPPESFAVLYSALGETDRAFEWLEKAYQQHSRLMTWLKVDPRFDSLRQDPRFNGLLQRSGLL